MRSSIQVIAVALWVALTPTPAPAQVRAADADTREVLAYRLTMAKLRQLNQFYTHVQADPAHQQILKKKKELEALGEKEELTEADERRMEQLEAEIEAAEQAEAIGDGEDQSLSAVAARMAGDPRVADALKRAGLTAREAVTMQFALFQAGFAASLLESGAIKEIPKDVSADNVKFYQANKAEIATLTALAEQGNS